LVKIVVFERGVGLFERTFKREWGVIHKRLLASEYLVPALSRGVVCVIVGLAVLTQYRHVTDRRTALTGNWSFSQPVQRRIYHTSSQVTYRVMSTSTAAHLSERLSAHIPAGPTRCSSTRPLLTYMQSDFARRFFCFTSPTVWNSLLLNIQSSPSQTTFKSKLKT